MRRGQGCTGEVVVEEDGEEEAEWWEDDWGRDPGEVVGAWKAGRWGVS